MGVVGGLWAVQVAAYSAGVSPPRLLWGRQVLYSILQASTTTRASVERPELGDVEQFVADPAVERLDPGVLPRGSGFDVDGAESREAAPVPQTPGDQFGSVVHPEMLWSAALVSTRRSITAGAVQLIV